MAEAQARKLFDSRIGNLHHLMSTAQQPGIFNSPYAVATGSLPVVMGMPLEDHLKATFRSQVRVWKAEGAGQGGVAEGGLPPSHSL